MINKPVIFNLILFFMLTIIGGCSIQNNSNTAQISSMNNKPETLPSYNENPIDYKNSIGDSVTVDAVTLKLENVTQSNVLTLNDNTEVKAEEGSIFLLTNWEIENNSNQTFLLSEKNINAYINNSKIEISKYSDLIANSLKLDSLKSGTKTKGILVFQIPIEWEFIEIDIDVEIGVSQTASFEIKKDLIESTNK